MRGCVVEGAAGIAASYAVRAAATDGGMTMQGLGTPGSSPLAPTIQVSGRLTRHRRRVLSPQQDPQVPLPGADVALVRAGQAGVDLADVVEGVHRPRGEQLPQGDLAP